MATVSLQNNAQPVFISMIKVDGFRIPIPPLVTDEDRKKIDIWRNQARAVEERLASKKQQCDSGSLTKSKLQSSKIGAIPARSANFEERPQSRNISEEQAVRRALTSAAYNDENAQIISDMLQKVVIEDGDSSNNAYKDSLDENGQVQPSAASGFMNSAGPVISSSSTDLEAYLSQSSTSTDESSGTVRPETNTGDASDDSRQNQKELLGAGNRNSYTIETPSSALLQTKNEDMSADNDPNKPQLGHLGSMVAHYLTEQQRVKNMTELAKLQSILKENAKPLGETSNSSSENSPSKQLSHNNGGGDLGSPSVAGVKRRRAVDSKLARLSASDRLVAFVRGYLVRRVIQTPKVQHWVQTVKDCCRLLAVNGSPGGVDWRSLADTRFREQVQSQLYTARQEFYEIMFDWPLSHRLALIEKENQQKANTPRSSLVRGGIKSRTSSTLTSVSSRTRSVSASSLQQQVHQKLQQKQSGNVIDVSKRRRIGAVTPPRTSYTNNSTASQQNGRNTRQPVSRPVTAAGGASRPGIHGPSRLASSRPNTAAPVISIPTGKTAKYTTTRKGAVEVNLPLPHAQQQSSSTESRRSTITGTGNSRR